MGLFGSERDRFAKRVVSVMRDAGVVEAVYEPEGFLVRVRLAGGGPLTAYLGNIFHECAGVDRAEQQRRIVQYMSALVNNPGAPDTWEGAAALLRPVLRTVTFAQQIEAEKRPVAREFQPMLNELVVVDLPESMVYVTPRQLASWGVPAKVAFDRARRNLEGFAAVSPPDGGPGSASSILRMVESGEDYWVSRLLVDGWLAGLAPHVGGRPVAFVPDPNALIVTADTPDTLAGLFELVEREHQEAPRALSTQGYTVDDAGRVVPYRAPVGHPLESVVHRSEVMFAAAEYASQVFDTDAFVASLLVFGADDAAVISVGSWAEGVDTLLPRAQYVSFPGDGGDPFIVPWAVVEREVDLEPEPGVVPERFRLRSWPHPGVVERLRRAAVEL